MPRALIFDMDGLMVDTEPLFWDVAREIAQGYGKSVSDQTLRRMMGRSRTESMQIYIEACDLPCTPEELLARREALMLERYSKGIEPLPGLREILRKFHGRLTLAVATSSPKIFTDVLLPALGIDRYFDAIQTGDDVIHGKPDPEIYLKVMSKLKLQPSDCIVLEDSLAGALSGKRAGATVIAVPTHLTANEDFAFADYRARDLHEAMKLIEHKLLPTPNPS